MASMVRTPRILNKFYVYDPNVSDTFGGLRVLQDKDDKGNPKDGTNHVLAVEQQVNYWIDQGLLGTKPVGEISESHKKLLGQITRGRSDDNDKTPPRVAKLEKRSQAGHPSLAGQPISNRIKQNRKKRQNERKQEAKPPKKAEPKVTPASTPITRG